jgi:hypothetical protein
MSETKIDDGGPAFPFGQISEATGQPINGCFSEGMSLRDWFAGNERIVDEGSNWELCEALAGKRPDGDWKSDPIAWQIWCATWQAKLRYIHADAMLKARAAR